MERNTISGKSPMRISFAGGGTDLDYVFEKIGGAIVSCTIDKYCHMKIEKRKDKKIYINNKILNKKLELLAYTVIDYFKPKMGFNLTYYNDLDKKSGLGGSSAFVIILLRLLNEIHNIPITHVELVNSAYKIETTLQEGGWQDQYSSAMGGFNFMEFGENKIVYPLRLKYSFIMELNEHFVLIKVEGKKDDIHKNLRLYQQNNEKEEFDKMLKIKELAYEMRNCFLNNQIDGIGKLLKKNWELKRNIFTSNKKIDKLYELGLKNGAEGGKICGSGQCGYFLFFVRPENRNKLIEKLKLKNYKIVNFSFTKHGVETWSVRY